MSFGNETFEYDGMGNPTTYRDMECKWEKGRQLKQIFDGATVVRFRYDVFGIRTSKTVGNLVTNYIYENGKLLRQTSDSGRIDFIYGKDGMIGFKTGKNGTINTEKTYMYRKNIFGDVTEIYDQNGNVVGKYSYSAFGECTIDLDTDGIAMENPIRYRGYYYDKELKLYYLKSRYYDPEVGRFITIDDLSYLDPENINGLNLYAYCGNDPVMNVDPDGRFFLSLLATIAAGVLIGGITKGTISAIKGDSFLAGFLSGALIGGALGAAFFFGGATMLAIAGKATFGLITASTAAAKLGLLVGSAVGSTMLTAGAGMGAYAINESMNGRDVHSGEMLRQGIINGIKGGIAFFTGMALATAGAFNYLIKGINMTMKERLSTMFVRSTASAIFQFPWKIGLR